MRKIFHRSYPLKIKMFQFDEILWITFIISSNCVTMIQINKIEEVCEYVT